MRAYRYVVGVFLTALITAPAMANGPSPESIQRVRLAITDLAATYPDKYQRAPEFLKRLDAVPDEAALGALQREALLANPLLDFDRLLLVKRALPDEPAKKAGHNLGLPQNWQGNCALPRAGYDNEIATLTLSNGTLTTLFKPEDKAFVGDVDLNFDADKLLFSLSGKSWHVWEIKIDGTGLRRVTPEEPEVDQYDACYLPDGRIIFDSTAGFQGVPCVGGGNSVANLYVMDADGRNVRELCYDQEHNWCPTVMNDGRVLYSRWEYTDTPHYFTRLLFTMNPDGTGQMALYGSNSYWPNSIFYARPIPGSSTKVVAVISGHHGVPRMGELIIFDTAAGRNEAAGAVQRIPGRGQKVEPVIRDGLVEGSWPKFLHPYPLSEKYFLVSCQPAAHLPWGIYLADVFDNLVLIKELPDYALFEPVPLRPTLRPPVIPARIKPGQKEATVYMADVYAGQAMKGVPRGTVKKLRVFEYHFAYRHMGGHINIGIDGPWDVHRILGTVPVNEDGSAFFKVPANTPVAVQPLDAEGRAVQIMRSWFTAQPGERASCVGCHEHANQTPPAKNTIAAGEAAVEITPWHGPARGFSFSREVQPVLDKFCVGCHNGEHEQRPDFTGNHPQTTVQLRRKKPTVAGFDAAYLELHPYVRRPGPESDYHVPKPYEYFAETSELVQMLRAGHHGVQLDAEAWDRLLTWIDLNVPDHGTWGEHRPIPNDYHEKRLAMRKKYGAVEVDPEAYPAPAPAPVAFVPPAPPAPVKAARTDWSYAGGFEQKILTVDIGGGQKLELVLVPGAKPFYMARREISNLQYGLCDPAHNSGYLSYFNKDCAERGVPMNQPDQPVVRVTWQQAQAFCEWLSAKTGQRFSLPTADQWEWACRAGTSTALNYGAADTDFSKLANLADVQLTDICRRDSPKWIPHIAGVNDGATATTRVNSYPPNAWGLFDMHGNAAEWTASEEQGKKIVKGGSFYDRPNRAASTARRAYPPYQPIFDVGFRVICAE